MTSKTLHLNTRLTCVEPGAADLALIHKFAAKDTTLDDFYTFIMEAINDSPAVKRGMRFVISPEWMKAHEQTFVGVPFLDDHRTDRDAKLGRVYASSFTPDDNSVRLRAYMARGVGNDVEIDRIRKGLDLEVSIGFNYSKTEEIQIDGVPHTKILPARDDPKDGPFEVSSVGLGAIEGARIAASQDPEDLQLTAIPHVEYLSPQDRDALLFGRMMRDTMIDDVVSYELQLKLCSDVAAATKSYSTLSPFHLQDKQQMLLKKLQQQQETTTQCSIDIETLKREAPEDAEYISKNMEEQLAHIRKGLKE